MKDGCVETIKEFGDDSGLNPALDFYPDPDGDSGTRCWMCGWKSAKKNKKKIGLRTHVRRKKHVWTKCRSCLTERKDIKIDKLQDLQDALPKVRWGDKDIRN